MNPILITRLKSFAWRGSMMTIAFIVSYLSNNIADLQLGQGPTLLLGLILGEVSKYLNTQK